MEDQLQMFYNISKNHSGILYFDTTGNIIGKIPKQNKPVFLYSFVAKNPIEGTSAVPIAEMLSNDHHYSEICHFLNRCVNLSKDITTNVLPRPVEVDFSYAIIQAVFSSFNQCDAITYILWAWSVVKKEKNRQQIQSKTYVHICSAHMHTPFHISKHNNDFILRCMPLLWLDWNCLTTTHVLQDILTVLQK